MKNEYSIVNNSIHNTKMDASNGTRTLGRTLSFWRTNFDSSVSFTHENLKPKQIQYCSLLASVVLPYLL